MSAAFHDTSIYWAGADLIFGRQARLKKKLKYPQVATSMLKNYYNIKDNNNSRRTCSRKKFKLYVRNSVRPTSIFINSHYIGWETTLETMLRTVASWTVAMAMILLFKHRPSPIDRCSYPGVHCTPPANSPATRFGGTVLRSLASSRRRRGFLRSTFCFLTLQFFLAL